MGIDTVGTDMSSLPLYKNHTVESCLRLVLMKKTTTTTMRVMETTASKTARTTSPVPDDTAAAAAAAAAGDDGSKEAKVEATETHTDHWKLIN